MTKPRPNDKVSEGILPQKQEAGEQEQLSIFSEFDLYLFGQGSTGAAGGDSRGTKDDTAAQEAGSVNVVARPSYACGLVCRFCWSPSSH